MTLLLVLLGFWILSGTYVITPLLTWKGQGLQPFMFPELARTDDFKLGTGAYNQGTVLGLTANLTATNDVQTITFTGGPTGGTFQLSFNGQQTGNIAFSATAATLAANVQTALGLLSGVGAANVSVAANAGAPQVTFTNALGNQWQPLILFAVNNLTGGASPNATVAHTTPGTTAGGTALPYASGNTDGTQVAKCVLQYDCTVDATGTVWFGPVGAETSKRDFTAPAYVTGFFQTMNLIGVDSNAISNMGRIVEGDIASLTNAATVMVISG